VEGGSPVFDPFDDFDLVALGALAESLVPAVMRIHA
jgi:hypothetical protein